MKRNSQYALYKGEKLVGIGTKKELSKLLKVRVETITFYTTPTHRKRWKNRLCCKNLWWLCWIRRKSNGIMDKKPR